MENELPTPDDLTLCEIQERFSTPLAARAYLESIRWPDGPVCPHCNAKENIWKLAADKKKKIREGLYQCAACKKQFTVTVGTIFEDSHIPLNKWLVAFYLLNSSKKGIAALQIQRMLGLGSYRTAHFMMHRIRHALREVSFNKPLGGTVEMDETYVGGRPRLIPGTFRTISKPKTPVVTLVERSGKKRSFDMKVTAKGLKKAVKDHVSSHATVITDDHKIYWKLKAGLPINHYRVNHSKREYALKLNDKFTVHTNTVESSFALLKRGIVGTFHSIGKQHLSLYLAEFDHRWNHKDTTDGFRTVEGLKMVEGKRLIYGRKKSGKMASSEGSTQEKQV